MISQPDGTSVYRHPTNTEKNETILLYLIFFSPDFKTPIAENADLSTASSVYNQIPQRKTMLSININHLFHLALKVH